MTVGNPTNSPESVRNRCVIEIFDVCRLCVVSLLSFSDGKGAFVIGLSQINSFFSL